MRQRPKFDGADIARHIRRMTLLLRGEGQSLPVTPRPTLGRFGDLVGDRFGDLPGEKSGDKPGDKPGGTKVGAKGGDISEQLRQQARGLLRQREGSGKAARLPGWWVLAQGAELDPGDFAARETAREELLVAVRAAGVLVGENVWVWDESGRAQLVLSTLPTVERARRVAERLRQKGLTVVVRREMA